MSSTDFLSLTKSRLKRRALLIRWRWWMHFRWKYLGEAQLVPPEIVSVIVPIQNVEAYLKETLESIRTQQYPHLEVILVDDASSDASAEIAEELCLSDPRFQLLRLPEPLGPGAARNKGLERATGEYITFVDSDDLLPARAIYRLVTSLRTSGSDFVVGAVKRIRGNDQFDMPWAARVHGTTRLAINLEAFPEALLNPFGWGKLFRKEYFTEKVGAFPERVFYEDQLPAALAYSNSASFDVLHEVTYLWRIRETNSSITQNRQTMKSLQDRITAIKNVREVLALHPASVQKFWLTDLIFAALVPFYQASIQASLSYQQLLTGVVSDLWNDLDAPFEADVTDLQLHAAIAVRDGDFDSLRELLSQN